MKSKKKILLVILTLMVLGIISISAYYFNTRNNDKLNDNVNSTEKVENTNTDPVTLDTEETKNETGKDTETKESVDKKDTGSSNEKNTENKDETSNVEESKKDSTTKTEEKKDNVSDNTESNQNQASNNEVNKGTEDKQENKNEETNSSSNSNANNNSNNTSNNTSSNSGVWDELGITEYDYYNSPMWSWAKVTHKTKTECIAAGEAAKAKELEKDESERKSVLFTCTEIYSYSGKYLGEMLEVEYLG